MDDATVLNPATIENLKQLGGDDFLHELIELFLEHSSNLVATINNGNAAAEWDQVSRAAHSLKSSAGNIGAFELQTIVSDLEQAAEVTDVSAITPLIDKLGPSFETVVEELKKIR
ncbi:Hpt domain-containing protein [Candidatus Neomarinimicrobiota bacterium]